LLSETAEIDPSTSQTGTYAIRIQYAASVRLTNIADQRQSKRNKTAGGIAPAPRPFQMRAAPTYGNFAPPSTWDNAQANSDNRFERATGKACQLQTLRVTFNDAVSPAQQRLPRKQIGAELPPSVTSFDPILFTDSRCAFVSQLLPSRSAMSFY